MKTIKILHMYYDIMNLYGENANIRVLERKLEEQGLKVSIDYLSIEDKVKISDYDFIYIGSGTEMYQRLVLGNIMKYKDDFVEAIDDNKYILVTGNALELFGKSIQYNDMDKLDALGIFDFYAKEATPRIIKDQLYECDIIPDKILGFQNHSNEIFDMDSNLFRVISGNGFNRESDKEGIRKNNFFGTYLVGPLLVRNPKLTDHIVKDICEKLDVKYKEPDTNEVMYRAHDEFIKNIYEK